MTKGSSYIREELRQAAHVLATGDRSLQDRPFYAAQFPEPTVFRQIRAFIGSVA